MNGQWKSLRSRAVAAQFVVVFALLFLPARVEAQNPPAVKSALTPPAAGAPATPQLSTAEKVAFEACEKIKQEAISKWQDAMQQEQAIAMEFNATHHGYHLNPMNFTVEPEAKAPVPAKK